MYPRLILNFEFPQPLPFEWCSFTSSSICLALLTQLKTIGFFFLTEWALAAQKLIWKQIAFTSRAELSIQAPKKEWQKENSGKQEELGWCYLPIIRKQYNKFMTKSFWLREISGHAGDFCHVGGKRGWLTMSLIQFLNILWKRRIFFSDVSTNLAHR